MSRYTVGSVTGYNIAGASPSRTSGDKKPATFWYVHDSAYCYRIVREFKGAYAERNAHRLAAMLNAPEPQEALEEPPMDAWRASLATHCRHGHPFTHDNTVWLRSGGRLRRLCRSCRDDYNRRRREARRAAA